MAHLTAGLQVRLAGANSDANLAAIIKLNVQTN